jgi:DNA modification methylase
MTIHYSDDTVTLHHGDALDVARTLADGSVDCIVTSPPYFGLRDYGEDGQYGLEATPAEYVETMRALFSELRRVLTEDGTLWLNIGDSYAGGGTSGPTSASSTLRGNGHVGGGPKQKEGAGRPSARRDKAPVAAPRHRADGVPAKNLLGIPWRVALALQDDGWILRNAIVWQKPNAMPESVIDRLSSRYEPVFLFSKARSYWFDLDAIREPVREEWRGAGTTIVHGATETGLVRHGLDGSTLRARPETGRNPGDVWTISTQPFPGAHFATMPAALAERCVQAGCKPGGTVLDPFSGSGTTGLAAARHGRKYVGVDLSAEYLDLSLRTRLQAPGLDFGVTA